MVKDFQLFLHTVDEYKRFANHLPVKSTDSLTDDYSEADYIGILPANLLYDVMNGKAA